MNCQHVQQLFDDLSRDRLPASVATRVRQHLADCTDCRVHQQRTARLQRLLALTRYEQPPPGYFDGVLTEFHRRQAALAQRRSWFSRLGEVLVGGGTPAWRYALASAAMVVFAWGAYWLQTGAPGDTALGAAEATANAHLTSPDILVTFGQPPAPGTWQPLVVTLPAEAPPAPAPVATPSLSPSVPAPSATSGQTPRYVLDRLPLVAASYDPARADF